MPTVPRYGISNIKSENPNIRIDTNTPEGAFGGGESFSRLMSAAKDFVQNENDRANTLALMEAERKMNDAETQIMYGSGEVDPSTGERKGAGLSFMKGKQAFEAQKYVNEAYGKYESEAMSELTPAQQEAFKQRSAARKAQLDSTVTKHVSNEIQKYQEQETMSYLKSEQNKAVKFYQDPNKIIESLENQEAAILKIAKLNSQDPQTTKLQLETARSKTHADVISQMISNGDDLGAEAYYKANESQITDEKELVSTQKAVALGSLKGSSQRQVDQYLKSGMNETQAFANAAKIENPRLREETEHRISQVYSARERARRQGEQDAVDKLTAEFDKTGEYPGSAAKLIGNLSDDARRALANYRDKNPLRDDGTTYLKLKEMAEDPATRDKFVEHDLWKDKVNLSKDNYEKLSKLRQDIKSGKGNKELDGAFSDSQVIQSVYESAGFKTKDKEDYAKYKNAVDTEVIKYKEQTGKKVLNNNDLRKIASGLTMEQITEKGIFFDTKKPKYLISQETSVDNIPSQVKKDIQVALKNKNKPATDDAILNLYKQRYGK